MSGYVPIATQTEVGAVKPDNNTIDVAGDGTLSVRAQGLLPPASEGDIAYFHAGNWIVLPPGAAGDALISNGTDPGYDLQRIAMAADGVIAGTKHEIDIDSTPSVAVTATPDLIDDIVHYSFKVVGLGNVPLGSASCSDVLDTNDATALTAKVFNVSGTPPTNWDQPGFNDSAWPTALHSSQGPNYAVSPTPEGSGGILVFRDHFTVSGLATIDHATVQIKVDAVLNAISINGTPISVGPGTLGVYTTYTIDRTLLVNGSNLIAIESTNDADAFGGVGYTVDLCTLSLPTGLGFPAGTEGDMLYFHSGAWQVLHVGPTGWVVSSNGTDPVWAAGSAVEVAVNGSAIGSEGEINFIPAGGVSITGVNNSGAGRVDVTISSAPTSGKAVAQSGHVTITIAAGSATNTAAVVFKPAFANPPDVIVSSESNLVIASAESITGSGFTARVTANVPLAPSTSLTAVLHWTVGGPSLSGKFKPALLAQFR